MSQSKNNPWLHRFAVITAVATVALLVARCALADVSARVAGWPESVYYHYYEFPAVHMVKRHYGIRTKRYKLIHFYHDIDAWELYDLEKDPRELQNVYDDPAYTAVRHDLQCELSRLQAFYRDSDASARRFVEMDIGK